MKLRCVGFYTSNNTKDFGMSTSIITIDTDAFEDKESMIEAIEDEMTKEYKFNKYNLLFYEVMNSSEEVCHDLIRKKPLIEYIINKINNEEEITRFDLIEVLAEVEFSEEYKGVKVHDEL